MSNEHILEAVLFAAGEAVPLPKLAAVIEQDSKTTSQILQALADKYSAENRGFLIIQVDNAFQMATNPLYSQAVQDFFQVPQKNNLTQALLETLAIIAYKQPVTKGQIEEIRGVSAEHAVNRLLEYGLIMEKGRLDAPGRPILFVTSEEFLKHFGLKNLEELPRA